MSNIDAGIHLAIIRYHDIPGIEIMQHLGQQLLALALFMWLAREAYRMVQGEEPRWMEPIVRVGVGFLVLSLLPYLGDWLLDILQTINNAMFQESKLALFGRSVATALTSTKCDDVAWYDAFNLLFSLRGWVALFSSVIYLGMFLSKVVVIDVLFPVCFALVLFFGVLSVPIALFPGMHGIGGWIRNLIEVSLWPLIFQLLVAMVAASYPSIIAAMADGQVTVECTPQSVASDAAVATSVDAGLFPFIEYAGVCVAYVVLVWFTPLLSAMVMRSAPVGMVGGILAAKAGALVGAGTTSVGSAFFDAAQKVGSQALQGGYSAALWSAQKIGQARSNRAARLDNRESKTTQQNATSAEKGRQEHV